MAFSYTNSKGRQYYLHSKDVKLRGGDRTQTIFYFAPDQRKEVIDAVPAGFTVVESQKTGLPVLKRKS
jgi:hypothetical protein